MKLLLCRIVLCSLLLITLGGGAYAHPKLSPDLEQADPTKTVDVIVQYRPGSLGLRTVLKSVTGLLRELPLIGAAVFRILPGDALAIANDPDVTYISLDRRVGARLDYANSATNANLAFRAGATGKGIAVAIVDSGISNHPDLRGLLSLLPRIAYEESFVPGDSSTEDRFGHGTHVAGIIAGDASRSTGTAFTNSFRGLAPSSRLINLRVLDGKGMGTDSAVITAIHRAVLLRSLYNIRVLNLSLGRPVWESYSKDPLCQAVEAAWKAGIFVVVAAGNDGRSDVANGYATIHSPANSPFVMTVGAMKTMYTATRTDDLIASYSSKGPTVYDHIVKPDLVAPGNQIVSLLSPAALREGSLASSSLIPLAYYQKNARSDQYSQDYLRLSGTSMAAPMVSGAGALLFEREPSLTNDQVKARLMKTASKTFPAMSTATDPVTGRIYTSRYDIFTIGAGYLDVWAALNNHDIAKGTAMSPTANVDYAGNQVLLVKSQSAVWGDSGPYGLSAVWGSSQFAAGVSAAWSDSTLRSDSAVWGDQTSSGFGPVWDESAVWGGFRRVGRQTAHNRRAVNKR